MKENYGKIITSIVLGIMTVLLFTLNLWGKEWYKLVTALFAGVVVGITIYDYHLILDAGKTAWGMVDRMINKIRVIEIVGPKVKKFKVSRAKIFAFLRTLLIIVINYGVYYYLFYKIVTFGSVGNTNIDIKAVITVVICGSLLLYSLTLSNFSAMIIFTRLAAVYEKFGFMDKGKNSGGDDTFGPGRLYFIWGAGWYVGLISTIFIACAILLLCLTTVLFIVQVIISALLTIGLLFKAIGQNNTALLIALSIVGGGLIGTLTNSYVAGITSGLLVFGLSLILRNVTIKVACLFKGDFHVSKRFFNFAFGS
jgi:hypothetical protein